ncbi:MAG: xylulokinase [Eubacteriales bacterium]|nr:xylulokinase [Eubacteriales bacterium]
MKTCLLGIDIGTSGCKVALFDEVGHVQAQATHGYEVSYPQQGWAEQDPELWWNAVCKATQRVVSESGVSPDSIGGIGVDGQSWSAIAIDKEGKVLCPTPIWTDTRACAICEELSQRVTQEELFLLSGNPLRPSYTLPKILWYKQHRPDVYERAEKILQSNGFIVYRMTGSFSQDLSQGYGLACFDMRHGCWNEAMAEKLGVRPSLLPKLYACHDVVGKLTQEAARQLGLSQGIPVVAGGLDAACGTLGAGVIGAGQTQEQGGQAGGMSLCIDDYAADPRLILGYHVVPHRWLLQGGTTGGGGALKWLRQTICPDVSFEEMSALAGQTPAGSEGVVFLPYMAGERSPLWNPAACGVFFGLSYAKNRGHLIRACMEGVAYSLRHNLETAQAAGATVKTLRSIGGSANSRVWTQLKADVTGCTIEVPGSDTATTLGAAILAGVGVGVYASFDQAVSQTIQVERVHQPNKDLKAVYDAGYQRYRRLYEQLKPLMTT